MKMFIHQASHLISFLKELIDIGSFICLCILVHSSNKNPFESHRIGNLSDYFYGEENSTLIRRVSIEEQIVNRIRNISSNVEKKNFFLRKLVSKSFCSEIYDDFHKYNGTKLSNIFDLNYGKVHKMSIATLVIYCAKYFLSCLGLSFDSCVIIAHYKNKCLGYIFSIALLSLFVAKYILSIILFYFMEKGDIEKYDDFLDCKNVKVKTFKKITDVNKLRNCFFAFVILNIINLGIEKLENILEKMEKKDNENNNINSISYSS